MVTDGINRIRIGSNGAMRQREVLHRTGSLTELLAVLVDGTVPKDQ